MTRSLSRKRQLLVCIKRDGYEVSLELRKIYVSIADKEAESCRMVRVVDESGDDYLFPEKFFLPITLPPTGHRAVMSAA
jgi:hypothetical protein